MSGRWSTIREKVAKTDRIDSQGHPEEQRSMKLARRRKLTLVALGLAVSGVGAVGAMLWRGIPFPSPTGRHHVGRTSYHLIDASRPEIFSDDPDDVRELMITVHYPADEAARAPRAPYADAPLARAFGQAFNTPSFVLSLVHSHALEKPPCLTRDGGLPVVIFSPG